MSDPTDELNPPVVERLAVALQYLCPEAGDDGAGPCHRQLARRRAHHGDHPRASSPGTASRWPRPPSPTSRATRASTTSSPARSSPARRPLAASDLVSPVDGAISQFGAIEGDQIFQAKGHRYSTTALVGGDAALAAPFSGGHFATLYLSPKDYHRIHMPCAGRLTRMIHVPGELFSVNPTTARGVPGLFARNERVVCVFAGERGPWILVLVGATIVGSMATVWHGIVNPPRPGRLREWRYDEREVRLAQGDEMGRFLLGSTVVLLFPPGRLRFDPAWAPGGADPDGRGDGVCGRLSACTHRHRGRTVAAGTCPSAARVCPHAEVNRLSQNE